MCEVNEITEFNEALTNYEIGGLFNFKPSKKYKSDTYDIYETDVDLSEHK